MHHITEDTPPDMLAGSMDLLVRLPDGREVKMSVDRGTPMMDLLVQVTTASKLRPSDHIMHALDMTAERGIERILPYKPNTPIGALDTQRVRVLPKGRAPAPKIPAAPGHQPFESTFRLQVHLPRNQFCVIRVGKHILLEDIMRRVCEEKNLDPRKYEFRHPANIDKVLDPKRTLNDYEITEITVVNKGSSSMPRAISSNDIMVLQREEERRKLQAKTGGGVLNLIFRRGRTSMGSGSISSDTRSISPTQSDDSRSVTPPAVQPSKIIPQETTKQPPSRPKPPQRKRRPAPKPPQVIEPPPKLPTVVQDQGLTICHSRNSSDSSGYHEASILSDNCNITTLPRRPKSLAITSNNLDDSRMEFRKSTGNLTNMAIQSKSTMSLTAAGRKKKPPPPPPVIKTASSVSNINTINTKTSPVVASSTRIDARPSTDLTPLPKPRTVVNTPAAPVPKPKPRTIIQLDDISSSENHNLDSFENQDNIPDILPIPHRSSSSSNDSKFDTLSRKNAFHIGKSMLDPSYSDTSTSSVNTNLSTIIVQEDYLNIDNIEMFDTKKSKSPKIKRISKEIHGVEINDLEQNKKYEEVLKRSSSSSVELNTNVLGAKNEGILSIPGFIIPNQQEWVVGDFSDSDSPYPATPSDITSLPRSSITSFQTDLSLQSVPEMQNSQKTVETKQNEVNVVDRLKNKTPNELINNENREELVKTEIKPLDTPKESPQTLVNSPQLQENDSRTVKTRSELPNTTQTLTVSARLDESSLAVEKPLNIPKETTPQSEPSLTVEIPKESPEDPELEWQYTLPSPPTAFRDDSPTTFTDMTNYDTLTLKGLTNDSVVTTPELFEKTESSVSENESISSGKPQELLASKYISLQNLEKRKSLVLERELTNLTQNDVKRNVLMEIEEVMQKKNSLSRSNSQSREKRMQSALDSALPNFKITTYDQPKKKINIFEDDSIRSNVEPKSSSVNTSKRNSISNDYYNTKTNDSANESSVGSNRNNSFGSHENIYSPKNDNFVFKKPHTPKYKHHHSSVTNITNPNEPALVVRSESFTQKNGIWSRLNPVKRSKSHVSLERYQDEQRNCSEESEEGLHKSNSLFNVSGLQSLEVMRMILPKLGSSPPTSPEKLNPSYQSLPSQPHVEKSEKLETNQFQIRAPPPAAALEKHEETEIKKYQYRGPPAINLSTWSERPKSNVSLKADNDYKINFTKTSIPSINIKVESKDQVDSGKINIKINSEPIAHHKTTNGNVIIKIGENETRNEKSNFYTRFLNQTQPTGYRKPLGNINGDKPQRPHSIAFDSSCPDLSRVPIVRAVELKKPFKDGGKTVTQIIHDLPPEITQNGDILGPQQNEDSSQTEPRAQTNQMIQNRGILGHRNQSGDVHNNTNIQNKIYSNNGTQNGDYKMKSSTLGAQNRHSIANDGFMGTNGIQNSNFVTKRNNFSAQYSQKTSNLNGGQNRHSIANDDFITKTNTQTLNNQNRNASVYLSSENLSKTDQNKPLSVFPKPITRGNSFAARLNNPRVTGFRMPSEVDKQNWISNKYGTLPSKTPEIIPFSQNQLKRTELNKSEPERSVFETVTLRTTTPKVNIPPPPPPAMPIVKAVTKKPVLRQRPIDIDPRDQLLESIRNFGGKAGLKAAK